jgi:hypothetical protein
MTFKAIALAKQGTSIHFCCCPQGHKERRIAGYEKMNSNDYNDGKTSQYYEREADQLLPQNSQNKSVLLLGPRNFKHCWKRLSF